MTRLLLVAAAVVAGGTAQAQYLPYGYGGYGGYGTSYNPYTGAVSQTAATVDPFTGNPTVVTNGYNPLTGSVGQTVQQYNPYTGTTTRQDHAYNPYTNLGYNYVNNYNPYVNSYGAGYNPYVNNYNANRYNVGAVNPPVARQVYAPRVYNAYSNSKANIGQFWNARR